MLACAIKSRVMSVLGTGNGLGSGWRFKLAGMGLMKGPSFVMLASVALILASARKEE